MTVKRVARMRAALERRQPDLRVLLDQVNKPHNLSAILRTCDAVGASQAHVVWPHGVPAVHRHSSAGVGKWVHVVAHPDIGSAIQALRTEGLRVYAAHPVADAVDYRQADYTVPCAVLMGAELWGVSEEALRLVDGLIAIPMLGLGASVNVSVATAVILYEAQRQRLAKGMYDRPRLDPETLRRMLFEWLQPRIARRCREQGLPYPELDEAGHLVRRPARRQWES
ncbi:MAG: tRNA (guanosine(18)-2'-O)-methyltransferase TrmH [Nitrococcus mobilis]|nr:tRNA (guanosine(18)-2'-O)-methyltransferase TrmH [Nitrococcus mobilis]